MLVSSLPATLDGLKLRAELAAALGERGWSDIQSRQAAISRVKNAISAGKAHAYGRLSGPTGGLEAARFLSSVMNAVLVAVFDSLARHFGSGADGVALVAIGGYGAGELAPSSDIDLLLLRPARSSKARNAFLEELTYVLWDSGLDIGGGAVRSVAETLKLAGENIEERTSLLSMRLLAGDPEPVEKLRKALADEAASSGPGFVDAKLKERDQRISKAGLSRYTVEPNIKESKGGLRDLQLLRWLAQFLYGADAFERWVSNGLLTVNDVEKYLKAADFLWTVRFHIHDIVNGKDDRLTFDIQPEVAARMGFDDVAAESAVERFMRQYFLTAMDVGSLTRLVCAKLESDQRKARPKALARFLPQREEDTNLIHEAFHLQDGRLDFVEPAAIEKDPILLIQLFWVAASSGADLHPDAIALVGQNIARIDDDFRSDPRAVRLFFAILLDSEAPQLVLRLMTEAGLLGAFLPEFGGIVARTQFNMYHRYTVDEHTLNLIGFLKDIEKGDLERDHPVSTRIIKEIHHRRALYLAALLHDTGKGKGDQCEEGAKQAVVACTRMGLAQDECDLVAWLVKSHLLMSDTAQRRDIGDPRTVIEFAEAVGSRERLYLLTLLTVVDIRSVGPGIWNGWKGQLLRDLFTATETVFEDEVFVSGSEDEARDRLRAQADEARAGFVEKLNPVDPDFAIQWAEDLDDSYWLSFSEVDRLRHAEFVRSARERGDRVATIARVDKRRAATEVMVLAPDRDRLFADLVAVLAAAGASVVGAQVFTTRSGDAFDVFYVQEMSGQPFGQERDDARDILAEQVRRAASSKKVRKPPAHRRLTRRAAAFTVHPSVLIDTEAAETATLVEASGRDRHGLLADLSRVLAEAGLTLQAALIDGYGERATDVFYVLKDGKKLIDPQECADLKAALMAVLTQEEERAEETARTHGIARARASAGR